MLRYHNHAQKAIPKQNGKKKKLMCTSHLQKKKTCVAVTIRIQTNLYETKTEFNIITHDKQTEKLQAMVRFNGCRKGNGNEKVKVFTPLYL